MKPGIACVIRKTKLLTDPEIGEIVQANSAACDFYGYTLEDLTSFKIWRINAAADRLIHRPLGEVDNSTAREFEFQYWLASGEIRDVQAYSDPVSVDGKTFLYSIIMDITARRRGERAIEQIQRLSSLGTLAAGIAHDFKNVLTGVLGNVSLARLALANDTHVHGFLKEAEKSIQRATRLSTQLLTFAKGGTPLKEVIDLEELVTSVTSFDLAGSSTKPEFRFQQPLHNVYGDPGQLQQVFPNLAINASQAMQDAGKLFVSAHNTVVSCQNFP